MVTSLQLPIREEEDFHELTLADGTVVPTAGYVQFVMNCGDYKGRIMARVFSNLHKECILGIPWLEYENPIIDWTQKTRYYPKTKLYSWPYQLCGDDRRSPLLR